jgi:pimeloyl-ACP methyl ester carboxylesterase
MATFVIVHGGWGGGWEWTPVARRLRERGHDVFTPTLTGVGERAHLGSGTGLADHIADVLAVLEFEELSDVILCGHSSGGVVVTGVADRAPERVRLLVYLDAIVPEDGQALLDLVPRDFADALLAAAEERGEGKVPYPPELQPPEGVIPEEARASYVRRTRPHPAAAMTEPVRLSGAIDRLRRAYVRCTDVDPEHDLLGQFAARARADGWLYRELATAHDLQLLDPDGTAGVLEELAAAT